MLSEAPKILIAEEDLAQQFKTRALFEECGCRVVEAASGPEAFKLALAETLDMILLDLRTPVLDGFEVARRLRKIAGFRGVQMIAYTARFSPGLTDEALECAPKRPLKLERVYLMGTSAGALAALVLATEHPRHEALPSRKKKRTIKRESDIPPTK